MSLHEKHSEASSQFLEGEGKLTVPPHIWSYLPPWEELTQGVLLYRKWIRVNLIKADPDRVRRHLEGKGVELEQHHSLHYMFRVLKGEGIVRGSREIKEGVFIFQDLSSAYVVETLSPEPGETLIDLASAPGNKLSLYMSLTGNNNRVVAYDPDPQRVEKERLLLKKMGVNLDRVKLVNADPLLTHIEEADKVLLDPPCSGTGTYPNDPFVIFRVREGVIGSLSSKQGELIKRAMEAARDIVVYSVCSVLPQEGEEVVSPFHEYVDSIDWLDLNPGWKGYSISEKVRRTSLIRNRSEEFFISRLKKR